MITSKHITKIVAVIMAIAVCLCLCAMVFADKLVDLAGGAGVTMEYESTLFDTSQPIAVNIIMDEADWEEMLSNATAEEYFQCDVEINGKKFYQVGIRPKGNTSLSSIASDPDTDRYSLKLEFDQYVDGQTCFGLDKLILNNNYADATNMKEALIYDMYQFIGADASLYNYAEISVNDEYWGVYLALEAVENSFLLRNYGTQDGELYKPDSMNIGGGMGGGMEMPDMSDMDFGDMQFPSMGEGDSSTSSDGTTFGGRVPGGSDLPETDNEASGDVAGEDNGSGQQMRPGSGTTGNPFTGITDVLNDLNMEELASVLETAGFAELADAIQDSDFVNLAAAVAEVNTEELAEVLNDAGYSELAELMQNMDFSQMFGGESGMQMPDMSDFGGKGGFSMGGSGANLNYSDDDLDSYSTIWDGAVSNTSESDHQRVVTALKNISEGTDLEEYMDVDNLLKYMAVHVFSVNADSLSGSMAHNYYLYEYDGVLNLLPWDYNLALGGMGGMSRDGSSSATDVVNDAIDNAFSSTEFFDTLMENEEYKAQYYAYLQQLVDEYLLGDGLEEFYTRTRNQIDTLVETDPNAFYTYDEYISAAETLYEVAKLRGESISGQIAGTIPSVSSEQADSDALIDASHLDLSVMGTMNMGGGMNFGDFNRGGKTTSDDESNIYEGMTQPQSNSRMTENSGDETNMAIGLTSTNETAQENSVSQETGEEIPEDFNPSEFEGEIPEGFNPSQFGGEMPEGFDPSEFGGEMPEGFDPSQFNGQMPGSSSDDTTQNETKPEDSTEQQESQNTFPGQTGDMSNMPTMNFGNNNATSTVSNLILYGVCFVLMVAALLFAKFYRRKPRKR